MRRAAFAIVLFGADLVAGAEYAIRWAGAPGSTAVEVEGISRDTLALLGADNADGAACRDLLAVYAEQPHTPETPRTTLPPIAGTWRIADGKIRFEPRFPLVPDVKYRAEFHPARLPRAAPPAKSPLPPAAPAPDDGAPVISFFELPRAHARRATTVEQIYPSGDVLPENQLKFYVQFSGPMSRGGIYEHVELREGSGRIIELPFLELDEELWDPAMTRLTLLIDPGRIKRGVKPLEDIGPVFEAGKTYTLAIKTSWRDANGQPLKRVFEKTFRATAADRTPPDPQRWTFFSVPAAGTVMPLVVRFDEPLDHALARRLIGACRAGADGAGLPWLPGDVSLDEQERRWTFRPATPWQAGRHALVVATTIEDLAGNNIGKPFDVELAEGARRQPAAGSVSVPFEVK